MANQDGHTEQLVEDTNAYQVFKLGHDEFNTTALPVIEDLGDFIKQYDFYSVMRLLESKHQVRFGTTKVPDNDPILIGQTVHMHFAPSSINKVRLTPQKAWLDVFFFGLTGPNGPLPTHLTERIFKQIKEQRDTSTLDFLNIFHHRLASLYYRAWANKEPIVQYDFSTKNDFQTYIGSLAGYGLSALQNRDTLPDEVKLKFAASLGGKIRHSDGLRRLIKSVFDIEVKILELTGEWLEIPKQHRCVLNKSYYAKRLGQSSTLGKVSWQCQYKFKVMLGPLDIKTYESFLPGTLKITQLNDAVRNYVGMELTWEIIPLLRQDQVPIAKLGQYGRIGWTCWLNATKLVRYRTYKQLLKFVRLSPPRGNEAFYTASSFTPLHCELSVRANKSIRIQSQQIS